MIDFKELRTAIVKGLSEHLDILVIMANQDAPKPDYPFMTYMFTTPMNSVVPQSGSYYSKEAGDKLDYGRRHYNRMTVSLTSFSQDSDEAHEKAFEAADWFTWKGYFHLKENNIVVVRIEAMTNRDTLIVGDYERRVGFDVQLRVPSKVEKEIEWIEEVEYEAKRSEG